MPEFDLVIRGGIVVDGTGLPRIRADVGIRDGRVAMVSGRINPAGAKELDASGCIVAPGAIDLHTHYDAQLNWDPYASLSGWFGVTSLTVGQCGFGFAPTRPEDRDLNMRMMNRIEAIPLESMRQGMRWDWETFPEYMDSLDRQGLGVNVGALVPFSPLRGYVLGMIPARERTSVTEAELNQMKQILHDSMKAGAFGISADKNLEDRPEDGSWLPSHVASKEEFLALAQVMSEFGVGQIGWTIGISDDRPEQRDMLAEMARLAAEQRRIQQALGALERELRGHRGAQKRVERIERDMGSVLRDMRRQRPGPRIAREQQRILQRMLDASRSIHARGFEKKRRSEAGTDRPYAGPVWLPTELGQSRDRWREAMKQALEGDYPREYLDLIRRYYELVYQDLSETGVQLP